MMKPRAGLLPLTFFCMACFNAPVGAQAPSAPPAAEPDEPVTVQLCNFDPDAIELGGSATLSVALTGPAPRGGMTIGVDMDVTGAPSTIVGGPISSLTVAEGKRTVAYTLQTQPDLNPASLIRITLSIDGSPACVTRLRID